MNRILTAVTLCGALMLTSGGVADAAKPFEVPDATKYYYFIEGAGKVPKKDSAAFIALQNYAPPVYYCWYAFHDFVNRNRGRSTARITILHTDESEESSPKLGGRFEDGEVFDCAVSPVPLEAGSIVLFQSVNKQLKGQLFDQASGSVEVYSEVNPLAAASAEITRRTVTVERPEPPAMRPVER